MDWLRENLPSSTRCRNAIDRGSLKTDCMGGWERAFKSQFRGVPAREQATATLPCAALAMSAICSRSAGCAVATVAEMKSKASRGKAKPLRLIFQVLPTGLACVAHPCFPSERERHREHADGGERSAA